MPNKDARHPAVTVMGAHVLPDHEKGVHDMPSDEAGCHSQGYDEGHEQPAGRRGILTVSIIATLIVATTLALALLPQPAPPPAELAQTNDAPQSVQSANVPQAPPHSVQSAKVPQAVEGGAAVYDYLYERTGYHNDRISHEGAVIGIAKKWFPASGPCMLPGWCAPTKRSLTIGCSHGLGVGLLASAGFDASGTDVAHKAIELATQRHGDRVCSKGPCFRWATLGQPLPFADNAFDIGISSDVLEHVPEKDIDASAAELSRIVRHFLVLRIANFAEYGKNGEKFGMGNLHITVHGSHWWSQKFAPFGWRMIADLPNRREIDGLGPYICIILGRKEGGVAALPTETAQAAAAMLQWWGHAPR